MDKQLYTTNEAAELLGVTPARVRQMVVRNEIESEKMGRDRFITAKAIEEAKRRKTKPGLAPRSVTTTKRATGQKNASNGPSRKGGKR